MVPRLRPFVLVARAACRYRWVWIIDVMILRKEPKCLEKNQSQSHFVHTLKSHVDRPGIEPELR